MRFIRVFALVIAVVAGVCGRAQAQSWTAPWTSTTGVVVTAAQLNQTRDNLLVLRAGGFSVSSQAIGDLLCASSTTQFGRLAGVATGSVLVSGGVATCPAYSTINAAFLSDGTNIPRLDASNTFTGATNAFGRAISLTHATTPFFRLIKTAATPRTWEIGGGDSLSLFESTATLGVLSLDTAQLLKWTGTGGLLASASGMRVQAAFGSHLASAGGFDFSSGETTHKSWGANAATRGTFAWRMISSDGSLNHEVMKISGDGATGGLWTVNGIGLHGIDGNGNAATAFKIRNTTSGSAGQTYLEQVAGTVSGYVTTYSQGYSSTGTSIASSVRLYGDGANGISIFPDNATGEIRFYSGGNTTSRGRVHASGGWSFGDNTDPGATNARVAGAFTTGGTITTGNDIRIPSGTAYYFDGGSNSYMLESSADLVNLFVGGVNTFRSTATVVSVLTGADLDVVDHLKIALAANGGEVFSGTSPNSNRIGNTNSNWMSTPNVWFKIKNRATGTAYAVPGYACFSSC